MNTKIENTISRISEEARGRFTSLLTNARRQTKAAANTVAKGKQPLNAVSKFGLQLTAHSHKTADKVLKQQTKLVENQINAFATRLSAAASATDFRNLLVTQIRLIPTNASQLVSDTRETFIILASAGQELGSMVKSSVTGFRGTVKPAARKAAGKTSGKTAKKKTSKVSKKKATARTAVAMPTTSTHEQKAA